LVLPMARLVIFTMLPLSGSQQAWGCQSESC
jgi:hypothetical protein